MKSLQVEEYFQAIKKEFDNDNDSESNSVMFIEPNLALIKFNDVQDQSFAESKEQQSIIIEDVDDNDDNEVEEESLLRKCLTVGSKVKDPHEKILIEDNNIKESISDEEETDCLVPNYVMQYFHNYVKDPDKTQEDNPSTETQITETSSELLDLSQECAFEVEVSDTNSKNNDTIICIYCDKVIDNIDNFNEHCKLENHDPLLTCPVCNMMFSNKLDWAVHYESHAKSEKCICERCGKQFTKRDSLYSHLNSVHNKNDLKFGCHLCTKKFATNYRLKLHMRIHTNDRPYCCEICGAVFTMLANLRNHQTIHSDYKPHVCLICNKGEYNLHLHNYQYKQKTVYKMTPLIFARTMISFD